MKKVFLDNLPRRGKFIDWENSVGQIVNFIYDDIKGEVEIIKYFRNNNLSYIDIKYNENIMTIMSGNFLKCKIGELLNTYTKRYKYNIGDSL